MPRFYLDIQNTQMSAKDDNGADYADVEQARQAAILGIREILQEEMEDGLIDLNGEVRILDEEQKVVATVAYSQAVTIRPPQS